MFVSEREAVIICVILRSTIKGLQLTEHADATIICSKYDSFQLSYFEHLIEKYG